MPNRRSLLDELLSEELAELISVNRALAIAPLEAIGQFVGRAAAPLAGLSPCNDAIACHAGTYLGRSRPGAREDATPCVHLNGFDVRRYKGQLWWVKSTPSLADVVLGWPSPAKPLLLPG